jgi:vitamin B12 transporter
MTMKIQWMPVSLAALAAARAFAAGDEDGAARQLEPVVVTATRTETPESRIGSAVTVITAEEIQARRLNTVVDVLRVVPGLDAVRSGGPGQVASVFLRGANANHTLMLVDGVEMNDPASPTGAFDFGLLQADNIERIEVVRGAASAVYGSDAIGGVINIITKRGAGGPKFVAEAQGGSFGTWKTGGAVSGGGERYDYSLDASRLESSGFSAADSSLGNKEDDGLRITTVSGRGGVKLTEQLDAGVTLRYNQGKNFLDEYSFTSGQVQDDPNYWGKFDELFTRGFVHLNLFGGFWEQTLGGAYSRTDRHYLNPFDPANPSVTTSDNLGEKLKLDYQSVLRVHETNTVTLGFEEEADSLSSASSFEAGGFVSTGAIPLKTMNTTSYYAQDQIALFDRSFTTVGVRFDDNNRFGGHVTWRVNELYDLKETGTRLKGSYGTGFKAPTLFQLYDTLYGTGNPDLKPETSATWDIGLEQDFWEKRLTLGASYFDNQYYNLIQNPPPFPFRSVNTGRAESNGVEAFVDLRPIEDLSLRGSYTYQQAKNLETGDPLFRRPRDKANFDADYRFMEKAHAHLNVLMVGAKADVGTTADPRAEVPGYVVVNLSGSYDIAPNVQAFARIDNLFDKKYEEVFGYGTSRIAGYGGVKLSF